MILYTCKKMHSKFRKPLVYLILQLLTFESYGEEEILDTTFPIIIAENREPEPESKSFFGYSVSLAEGPTQKHAHTPSGWIFVGAPKANASAQIYDSKSPKEPGAVWRCSLGRKKDSCEMVNLDPSYYPKHEETKPGAPPTENFDGSLIGSVMGINHGRFVTCGHRWNRGKKQYYQGICYWFYDADVQRSVTVNDLTSLVNTETYEQRLTPLFDLKDANKERLFNFTNKENLREQGREWQLGLAGASVHLYVDDNDNAYSTMPNLLLGAPGVREFAGAVVLYKNNPKPKSQVERPNRNTKSEIFSEYVVGNRGAPVNVEQNLDEKTNSNQYFGYSVTSGRYFEKNKILFAAGAPRANFSGEVVIFDIPQYEEPSSTYKRQISPILEIPAPANSFGSYFGSVLYTADFNGDGLDELVVGAPTRSFESFSLPEKKGRDKRSEKLKPSDVPGDEGCVYIYKFQGEGKTGNNYSYYEELSGVKAHRARFGSAISSMEFKLDGSNRDIYLIVGAPYESSYDGTKSSGVVYLYKYNVTTGKFGNFVQRIVASEISPILNGFGSSLSLPADIDENQTPDFSVGAFKSGHAVVLRTRPKIRIESWVQLPPDNGKQIKEIRRGLSEFILESCFKVTKHIGILEIKADIWVRVKFSERSIRFHRDVVSKRDGNTENDVTYLKKISTYGSDCENLTIVSSNKNGIGMDASQNFRTVAPFRFVQNVWYNETSKLQKSTLIYYASDGKQLPPQTTDFKDFDSRKPSPYSVEFTRNIPVSLTDCKTSVCEPQIKFSWSFYNMENENISSSFTLGSSKDIIMRIAITNTGESAPKPTLTLSWNYVGVKESSSGNGSQWLRSSHCKDKSEIALRVYHCPLGFYIKKKHNLTIDIQLNMEEIYASGTEIEPFEVDGVISFADKIIRSVTSNKVLPLYVPLPRVLITGTFSDNVTLRNQQQYFVKYQGSTKKMQLYSPFRQKFTVEVRGVSLDRVVVQIKLPVLATGFEDDPVILVQRPQKMPNVKCIPSAKIGFYDVSTSEEELQMLPQEETITAVSTSPPPILDKLQPSGKRKDVNDTIDQDPHGPRAHNRTIAIDVKHGEKPVKHDRTEMKDGYFQLTCESESNCMEITCTATNVKRNTLIHLSFEMYPVKDVIDTVMKSSGKSMVFVEGSGTARIFDSSSKLQEDNDVAHTILLKLIQKEVEIWIYIVAGLGGLLFLALIIFALYKIGFFKREKRNQLNEMKAEQRKSMIASARSSLASSCKTDIFTSREILTDAEQLNEDINEPATEPAEPEQEPTEIKDDKM